MESGEVLGFMYEDDYMSAPPDESAEHGFANTLEYNINVKGQPMCLDLYWSKDVDNEPWYLVTQSPVEHLRFIAGFAPLNYDA